MKKRLILLLLFVIIIITCFQLYNSGKNVNIKVAHTNQNISYQGRIGLNEPKNAKEIYWPGSSVTLKFYGTEIKAIIEDENGDNYFNVIVDGQNTVLKLTKGVKEYSLAENLSNSEHTVRLYKRNDFTFGTTYFYEFNVTGSKILPRENKPLFFEFYGDSVTTGYGNEDYSGNDNGTGDVSNNYLAYGAITARHFNAETSTISLSGIGLMVSWFDIIMPELYSRLNPFEANSKWNFLEKQADVVVVNLLQNDSWILQRPNEHQFKKRFGNTAPSKGEIVNANTSFIKNIRQHYPKAKIICVLGNMDITKLGSTWPDYISQAVNQLNDSNVHTLFVPYKNTPGHPKVEEQERIANALIKLIESFDLNKN